MRLGSFVELAYSARETAATADVTVSTVWGAVGSEDISSGGKAIEPVVVSGRVFVDRVND
jgi:hypothetical protein